MSAGWKLTLPQRGILKVDGMALLAMAAYRQFAPLSAEAGGVLIGRLIVGSQDLVVDSITTPQARDRRSRFRIDRLDPEHQRLVNEAFNQTGGTYLGEWHTHPEAHPTPSCIDLKNWRHKVKVDKYYGTGLVFLILGTESIGGWYVKRGARTVSLLGMARYDSLDSAHDAPRSD